MRGGAPAIAGEELWGLVKTDDSFWEIEEVAGKGRCVVATLVKCPPGDPWEHLLKAEPLFVSHTTEADRHDGLVLQVRPNPCPYPILYPYYDL